MKVQLNKQLVEVITRTGWDGEFRNADEATSEALRGAWQLHRHPSMAELVPFSAPGFNQRAM